MHEIYLSCLNMFSNVNTIVVFIEIASDGLKGRVFEVSLADLQNDEVAFRKFKLITEDVIGQDKHCLISTAWIFPMTRCAQGQKRRT